MCTSYRTGARHHDLMLASFPPESIAIAVIAIMITIIGWSSRLRRFDIPSLRLKLLLISSLLIIISPIFWKSRKKKHKTDIRPKNTFARLKHREAIHCNNTLKVQFC